MTVSFMQGFTALPTIHNPSAPNTPISTPLQSPKFASQDTVHLRFGSNYTESPELRIELKKIDIEQLSGNIKTLEGLIEKGIHGNGKHQQAIQRFKQNITKLQQDIENLKKQ
jgi:hypothetical protein